jgi:hypothetical protein
MKRLHHQSDAVAIWVKETKRQGRIAHHHADATVPHIVALLGFSFHAANIRSFSITSKFWSSKCRKNLFSLLRRDKNSSLSSSFCQLFYFAPITGARPGDRFGSTWLLLSCMHGQIIKVG